MTIKAEVRTECAHTGEGRTYRLSVEQGSLFAPNPEHLEGIAKMLMATLTAQANADAAEREDDDPDDAEWRQGDGGKSEPL